MALFTGILGFFTFKIWQAARKSKQAEGDVSLLYEDKSIWIKYSLFYDCYQKKFWWTFIPAIAYMFAKGCVVAAADGHGFAQTIAQLVIEGVMLVLLVFVRPYERRSGNVINIFIQVVRALSVVCILVFVEGKSPEPIPSSRANVPELGISQTTQTITGVVLIVVQSVLTGLLAILIAVNAIIICCKENPHRKRRKEAEKVNRDSNNLTSLDPHNSLLKVAHKKSISTSSSNYSTEPKLPLLEPANPYGSAQPTIPVLAKQTAFSSHAVQPANNYGPRPGPGFGRKPVPGPFQGYAQRSLQISRPIQGPVAGFAGRVPPIPRMAPPIAPPVPRMAPPIAPPVRKPAGPKYGVLNQTYYNVGGYRGRGY